MRTDERADGNGAAVEAGPPIAAETATSRRCERRRGEILEVAARLFAEHGYSDAVTQLLAEELKVGKGTIYRYFPSKRELFLAAADRAMAHLFEEIDAAVEGTDDPLERVKRGIRAYLGHFADHPGTVELLIQERAQFRDRDTPTYIAHRQRIVERWRENYRTLMAQGRVRAMSAERLSDVMAAVLYGSMFLSHLVGRSGQFAGRPEDIIDVVFHGILSDEERARCRTEAS